MSVIHNILIRSLELVVTSGHGVTCNVMFFHTAKCMKISFKKIKLNLLISNKNRRKTARRVVARDQNCHIIW